MQLFLKCISFSAMTTAQKCFYLLSFFCAQSIKNILMKRKHTSAHTLCATLHSHLNTHTHTHTISCNLCFTRLCSHGDKNLLLNVFFLQFFCITDEYPCNIMIDVDEFNLVCNDLFYYYVQTEFYDLIMYSTYVEKR